MSPEMSAIGNACGFMRGKQIMHDGITSSCPSHLIVLLHIVFTASYSSSFCTPYSSFFPSSAFSFHSNLPPPPPSPPRPPRPPSRPPRPPRPPRCPSASAPLPFRLSRSLP